MDENTEQIITPEYSEQVEAPAGPPIKKIVSFVVGFLVIIFVLFLFLFVVLPKVLPKQAKDVTLNYWIVFEDPAPFRQAAQEFHRLNPHITVNVLKKDIKTEGKYIERLDARAGKEDGADIFRFHNSWLPEIKPLLSPLPQDVVKATELDSKFYPVVARDLNVNGAYYGVPVDFDTISLFVNIQLFRNEGITSYPTSWNDMINLARQLTVVDQDSKKITTSGIALGTYANISHAPDIISLLMIQNGADINNLTGDKEKNAYEALGFYSSFASGDNKVWDDSLENSTIAFAKGKVAMYLGYSWDIFQIKSINPDLQFAVAPVPQIPGGIQSTVASYWVEGVSSASPNQKAAFEFLKFLASRENMSKMYSEEAKTRPFGELYPRSDMAQLLKDNVLVYPFVAQGNIAESTIFSADTYDERMVDGSNKYLGDAVRSIVNQGTSPQTALETLAQGVKQQVGQYARR